MGLVFGYDRRKIVRQGIDCIRLGLVGQSLGAVILCLADQGGLRSIAALMIVLGTGVLVGGCGIFARYHRLSTMWGLLGFLNVLGVAILGTLSQPNRARSRGFAVVFPEPYRRDVWRMDVQVKLKRDTGKASGVSEPILLQLPRGANVGTAMKVLSGAIPALDDGVASTQFLINGQSAGRRDELSNGDELIVAIPRGNAAS